MHKNESSLSVNVSLDDLIIKLVTEAQVKQNIRLEKVNVKHIVPHPFFNFFLLFTGEMDRARSLQINQIFVFRLDLGFSLEILSLLCLGKHHWPTLLCYRIYFSRVFGKKCDPQIHLHHRQSITIITVITVSLNAVLRLN